MYGYESPDQMMEAEDSAGMLDVDPEDSRRFREKLERDGEVRNFESKRRRRDGSVFWASTSAHTVRGRYGEVICHEGITQDITDLKKTQEALRESEEQFRSLADNAGLGIYLIQDDVFRYVNKKFADTYGYRVDEIVDKMGSMDLVIPDDAAIVAENTAKRISGEVDFINYELRVPRRNNEVITVEIHGGRTVRQGRPAIIGTVQDITDRKQGEEALKQAESKYRSIFEDALMGIFQTTPAGRIVAANPAFSRMLGYGSPEDLMNSITDLATQLYVRPEDRLRFHGILSSGQLVEELDTEFRRKDGSVLSVRMNARAVKDARGDIFRYEGSAVDITARKEAEEALRASEQRFRSLVETTSDWIWEVDQNAVYTYASPKIKDILGYEPEEVVGKTPFDFMDPGEA
jgi:PAS domain S-box-containing protein